MTTEYKEGDIVMEVGDIVMAKYDHKDFVRVVPFDIYPHFCVGILRLSQME